jgi:hypothetical protein
VAQVASFVSTYGRDGDFEDLARRLFAWQRRHCKPYARLAEGARPTRAEEIPSVPVALFQAIEFSCVPPSERRVVFRTSGTTGQLRGRHVLPSTELYDLSARVHFRARVPAPPCQVASLCPRESDSSLGHMLDRLGRVTGFFEGGDLADGVAEGIGELAKEGPVFLAATAFSLDALLQRGARLELGSDSLVMVTGGFKGRRVTRDAAALYAGLRALGTPRVVGEYGMTELSSQGWTEVVAAGEIPGPFVLPPWMRAYAVDPITGRVVDGEGQLRFVDLANGYSVCAIETMDVGRVVGDRLWLRGRLEGAELRGCSLRAEELLSRT